MGTDFIVIFLGLLILLAHVFYLVSSTTRIPDILWLFAIGILIGPVLGIVSPRDFGVFGPLLTAVTLILLLLESGLELHLSSIGPLLRESIVLTFLNFIGSTAIITAAAVVLTGLGFVEAMILGSILGGTSSAVITTLARQSNISREVGGILIIESAVSDIFTLGVPLALIEAFSSGHVDSGSIGATLIASFAVAVAAAVIGVFMWSWLHKRFPSLRSVLFSLPAFVFLLYGVVELTGGSGPISVLIFAIVYGNLDKIEHFTAYRSDPAVALTAGERMFIGEIVFLLRTFFFVYIGISARIDDIHMLGIGLLLLALLLLIRIPVVQYGLASHRSIADASVAAVAIPKGLGAAVLASIPLQRGMSDGAVIQKICFAVIVFSTIVSILMAFNMRNNVLGGFYHMIFRVVLRRRGDREDR